MREWSSRRRGFAAIACLLWLLGIEVLPNLHLAAHRADHTHQSDGVIVQVTFEEHVHADGDAHVHDHSHSTPGDGRSKSRAPILAFDDVPSGHAAAGLAHRCIALHESPVPVALVERVDIAYWVFEFLVETGAPSRFHGGATARGPPIV